MPLCGLSGFRHPDDRREEGSSAIPFAFVTPHLLRGRLFAFFCLANKKDSVFTESFSAVGQT